MGGDESGDGLAHLVSTPKSFELGGHMGYQNSYLDESFLFHSKKIFGGAGVVWNSPSILAAIFKMLRFWWNQRHSIGNEKVGIESANKKILIGTTMVLSSLFSFGGDFSKKKFLLKNDPHGPKRREKWFLGKKFFLTPQPPRGLGLRRGATPKPKIFKIANFYLISIFSTLIFRKNVS